MFTEKQVIFKCFQKPQVSSVKIKLCLMGALFSCFPRKAILTLLGGTGGKNRAKCEKRSFSHGLSKEFFEVVAYKSEQSILN